MTQTRNKNSALLPSPEFIAGGKHVENIGHYIDCSENPYDLRPAANVIIEAASSLKGPVAIIFGEPHYMPSRIELQHLVASRLLQNQQKFTVHFEYEHNYWALLAKEAMGKKVPTELLYNSTKHDPNGSNLLTAFLGVGGFGGAPVAFDNLMAFCLENKIPVTFNEAARDQNASLDMSDPITESMTKHFLATNDVRELKLNRSDKESIPTCMAIANLTMAFLGKKFAAKHKADFVLQQAGLNHVFGTALHDCRFEESLTATYEEMGFSVLPVFPTIQSNDLGLNILPESAHSILSRSVVIDGLAEDGFMWKDKAAEKAFIQDRLYKSSGKELTFRDVEAEKARYKKLAHDRADTLMRKYELP